MGDFDASLYPLIERLDRPAQILLTPNKDIQTPEMEFSASRAWPYLAQKFKLGEDCEQPDLRFFISMQDPVRMADYTTGDDT